MTAVVYGDLLKIDDLKNFVDDYLMKTEPNNFIKKDNTQITKIELENSIKIEEVLKRPVEEPAINKKIITTLELDNFEISISSITDATKTEKLVYGKYHDNDFKEICEKIDEIFNFLYQKESDETTDSNYVNYCENVPVDYLICYDKDGYLYKIFPLGKDLFIKDKEKQQIIIKKMELVNNIIKLITKFLEKHNIYLNLNPVDLKNKIYVYKLTSPYQTGKPIDKQSVGMQTEGVHMDECNIADSYVDDQHCELSSIIYTSVSNNKSPVKNYYSSAGFFFASEFPMPGSDSHSIKGPKTFLPQFQEIYQRLFISTPMTSSGWAIWKNKPKRYIPNENNNRFNISRENGFNVKKDLIQNKYTHFSKEDDEFIEYYYVNNK